MHTLARGGKLARSPPARPAEQKQRDVDAHRLLVELVAHDDWPAGSCLARQLSSGGATVGQHSRNNAHSDSRLKDPRARTARRRAVLALHGELLALPGENCWCAPRGRELDAAVVLLPASCSGRRRPPRQGASLSPASSSSSSSSSRPSVSLCVLRKWLDSADSGQSRSCEQATRVRPFLGARRLAIFSPFALKTTGGHGASTASVYLLFTKQLRDSGLLADVLRASSTRTPRSRFAGAQSPK
jgi:hypothetical protein